MDLGKLVLAERMKKKDAPRKRYKSSTKNLSLTKANFLQYEKDIFKNGSYNYWLSKRGEENIIDKRCMRQELFALRGHFI